MNTRRLVTIAAAAVVVFTGVHCAPVDPPGSEEPPPLAPAPPAVSDTLPFPAPGPASADPLQTRIDAAVRQVKQRDLLTTNGFWTVFHGILGLGPSVELLDPFTGKRCNALDYIADARTPPIRGLRFLPTPDGLDVETQAGSFVGQGHQDQFVAEMVEWNVSPDRVFMVNGKRHTFQEFINESRARASVKEKQELDWAVVIIGQSFPTDAEWTNRQGDKLHLADLLKKELGEPLDMAACGGTHRLYGMTWVYHKHLSEGGKADGVWKEVADKITEYKRKAQQMQNVDASFSTNFFRAPGNAPEIQLRINTTGHILEWLSLAGTDEELRQPWMRDAANTLAMMILDNENIALEGGSVYHAVHGLLLYRFRVFGADGLGPMTPDLPPWPEQKGKAG
ncbi:MAG TPA: hypothetical protein VMS17_18220 [Gemmataceae bacterium]|nr:hypothetical protein [Gemmataceae bacterium]